MPISIAEVEAEIQKILQGGIRRALLSEGFRDVEEEIRSIFEQLSLIVTAEPSAPFAFFAYAVRQVYRQLGVYLEAVRTVYQSTSLAGLPTSLSSSDINNDTLQKGLVYLHVFDAALSGEEPVKRYVNNASSYLDDIATEAVSNVRDLTVHRFDRAVRQQIEVIESAYSSVKLSSLEDYLENLERFSLTSSSLSSVAEKIREQLSRQTIELGSLTREETAEASSGLLSLVIAAKTLLQALANPVDPAGTWSWGPEPVSFPDDDIILEGTSGATVPGVVVYSGKEAPLTVTADPEGPGSKTSRVLADNPHKFALEVGVTVQDEELFSGTGHALEVLKTFGTGAVPVTPPDPTSTISDTSALFESYGVKSGDFWWSITGDIAPEKHHVIDSLSGSSPQTELDVVGEFYEEVWKITDTRTSTTVWTVGLTGFSPSVSPHSVDVNGVTYGPASGSSVAQVIDILDSDISAVHGASCTTQGPLGEELEIDDSTDVVSVSANSGTTVSSVSIGPVEATIDGVSYSESSLDDLKATLEGVVGEDYVVVVSGGELTLAGADTVVADNNCTASLVPTSIDYEIYGSTTRLLQDLQANFGPSLLGSRISVDGIGEAYITRVIDKNNLELSDDILPIGTTMEGGSIIQTKEVYRVYKHATPSSRVVDVTDGTDLFDYDLPPRIPVRLTDASGDMSEHSLETVVEDQTFLVSSPLDPGSYTVLFVFPVQPGDKLYIAGENRTVIRVLGDDLISVSPPIDSDTTSEDALVLPPDATTSTRTFYDGSVVFSDYVLPGNLLIVTVDGQMRRCLIESVGTNSLRIDTPLPIDRSDLDYTILLKEDAGTRMVTSSSVLTGVNAGDILSPASLPESNIDQLRRSEMWMKITPGRPVTDDDVLAVVTRGGVKGFGHYFMLQTRLFGVSPLELLDPSSLREKIGFCITDPSDVGSVYASDTSGILIDAGNFVSGQVRSGTDLTGIRFGDMLALETDAGSGPVTVYRYVRDWVADDGLVSFFPSINLATYDTELTSVELRRPKSSDALYEARQIELSIRSIREAINQYVSPRVPAVDSFLAFLASRKYDRAIDLVVSGDWETLASSSSQSLSYAGRLGEVLSETNPLLT